MDPNTPSAQLARIFSGAVSATLPDDFSAVLIVVNLDTGDTAVDTIHFPDAETARAVLRAAVKITEECPPINMDQDPLSNPDVRPELN